MKNAYFDKVIQPGQAGHATLEFSTEVTGPASIVFEFVTNDPVRQRLKLTLKTDVKPLPAFVDRIDNADLALGQGAGGFRFWPTAHPRIYVEKGEPLEFWLRARPGSPAVVLQPTAAGGQQAETPAQNLPSGTVTTAVRSAERDREYWLDVKVTPVLSSGVFRSPLVIPAEAVNLAGAVNGSLDVTLIVVDSSIVLNPRSIDLGEISISSLDHGSRQVAALNVRQVFGSLAILEVSSCAGFLRFDVQTLMKGKNYLLRIKGEGATGAKPGLVECPVVIKTDDPRHPSIEVPLKARLLP